MSSCSLIFILLSLQSLSRHKLICLFLYLDSEEATFGVLLVARRQVTYSGFKRQCRAEEHSTSPTVHPIPQWKTN